MASNTAARAIDWVYPEGRYQDHFRVYGQVDKPCRRCKTRIERILVGQRSTPLLSHLPDHNQLAQCHPDDYLPVTWGTLSDPAA